MTCLHPIWIKTEKLMVPCGKCVMCKISRSKDWATRIMHETGYHLNNIFLTITYDEEHLPKNGSISKTELQKFIKRLRHYVPKFNYYACGEYGEIKMRPHYHLIMFGLSHDNFILNPQKIHNSKKNTWENCYTHKAWPKGQIHIGDVTYDSARYVADYCQKKYYGDKIKEIYGEKEQPFQLISKGIGRQYALDNEDQIKQKLGITIRGKEVGLNKYYRKILGIEGIEVAEENKRRIGNNITNDDKILRRIATQLIMENPKSYNTEKLLTPIYDQRKKNYESSLKLRRKKEL